MSINNLDRLSVWRNAMEYSQQIYRQVIPLLPSEEKWANASQIRRSAQSIPANIAEGHGRFYYQEGIRFCYIARGSLEETQTYIELAHNLGYLPDKLFTQLCDSGQDLIRLINGYIGYLKNAKTGSTEPGYPSVHEPTAEYLLDPDTEHLADD